MKLLHRRNPLTDADKRARNLNFVPDEETDPIPEDARSDTFNSEDSNNYETASDDAQSFHSAREDDPDERAEPAEEREPERQ